MIRIYVCHLFILILTCSKGIYEAYNIVYLNTVRCIDAFRAIHDKVTELTDVWKWWNECGMNPKIMSAYCQVISMLEDWNKCKIYAINNTMVLLLLRYTCRELDVSYSLWEESSLTLNVRQIHFQQLKITISFGTHSSFECCFVWGKESRKPPLKTLAENLNVSPILIYNEVCNSFHWTFYNYWKIICAM